MSKPSRSPMRSLILPAALLLATAPAFAQTGDEQVIVSHHAAGATTRAVAVETRDLNLADGRDYARLERRVADAADRVCASDAMWNQFASFEEHRCRNAAIAGAMAHLPTSAAATN